jgi:hypothetical protein
LVESQFSLWLQEAPPVLWYNLISPERTEDVHVVAAFADDNVKINRANEFFMVVYQKYMNSN